VPCSSYTDAHGTAYLIEATEMLKTPKGHIRPQCPFVDVWWSRGFKAEDETLIIRQEYADRSTADVIELSFGQVYDLIDALNRAVENQ
jgi:hypothetical protein